MMDNEQIERLEAIVRDDPSNIESWLVLSDALIEARDPRGALIAYGHRLQEEKSEEKRQELQAEIDRIWTENKDELVGLTKKSNVDVSEWKWGYVWKASIFYESGELTQLLSSRCFRLIRSLGIGRFHPRPFLRSKFSEVLELLNLVRLSSLNLCEVGIRAEGAIALSKAKALKNLCSINLSNNEIGDEGAIAIARSETLKNLRHLDLCRNSIGDSGAKEIAWSSTLSGLHALNIARNRIGVDGARTISESKTLKNLFFLNLLANRISDQEAKTIAGSRTLENYLLALNERIIHEYA
jgi:Leucine-rich repeat (LRR) protein